MKRRSVCLLLTGLLVLGLTACKACGGVPYVSPEPSMEIEAAPFPSVVPTPTAAPAPTPEPFAVREADVPPGEYEPWQEAYAAFLCRLRQEEGELRNWIRTSTIEELEADPERSNSSWDVSDSYSLYDVDKDGIPELFVRYGMSEAAHHTVCYTFRDGGVTAAGEFESGHSSLYTWPGENAVVFFGWQMKRLSMVDGVLTYQEDIPTDDYYIVGPDGSYWPNPSDVIPGAEYIPTYRSGNWTRSPEVPALLLPVYDYGSPPRQNPTPIDESQVRAAIGQVLWEGAELYGVSGDGYHGDTGWSTLEEYLQPDVAYPYNHVPLTILQYAWADANGDGQTDCILRLGEKLDETRYFENFYVILSLEDGTVYAYFSDDLDHAAVVPNGSVYFHRPKAWNQLSFYKNQCYQYPTDLPVQADDLAWDDFTATP